MTPAASPHFKSADRKERRKGGSRNSPTPTPGNLQSPENLTVFNILHHVPGHPPTTLAPSEVTVAIEVFNKWCHEEGKEGTFSMLEAVRSERKQQSRL